MAQPQWMKTMMAEHHKGGDPPWPNHKWVRTMVADHLVGIAMIGRTLNGFGSSWLNPRA